MTTAPEPQVTVVVPVYKCEFVNRAIASVLSQQRCRSPIIIVNDGDPSFGDPRSGWEGADIHVVNLPSNQGSSAARNAGLQEVQTDFVCFLDADDFQEGELLATLVTRMRAANADLGFAPMRQTRDPDSEDGYRRIPDFNSARDLVWKWVVEGRFINPSGVIWRTEYLRRIGGWNRHIWRNTDGELVLRAALNGARFVNSDLGSGVYVAHDGDRITRRTDNLESLLAVGEDLLRMSTLVVSARVKRKVLAVYFYHVATQCDRFGLSALASIAERRSRELGLLLPGGSSWFRRIERFRQIRGGNVLWSWAMRCLTFPGPVVRFGSID